MTEPHISCKQGWNTLTVFSSLENTQTSTKKRGEALAYTVKTQNDVTSILTVG